MTKSTLVAIIACSTGATALYCLLWTGSFFIRTLPVQAASVAGASTEPQVLRAVQLQPYPTVASGQPFIEAGHYALLDVSSGKIVIQKSAQSEVPIASTTKLMTSHIVSKYGRLGDTVTVSSEASSQPGSLANLVQGENLSVHDTLYCMLLVSGNDAAHALAEYVGGILLGSQQASAQQKTERFVQEMNAEAVRLHMQGTHYADPAGFNDEGHSTAADLAKIASLDVADPLIQPIMGTANYTAIDKLHGYRHDLHNSDRLITDAPFEGTVGGKTGFTDGAGHCLVSAAKRDGHTLVAIILNTNAYDTDASAREARKLLDFGFRSIVWQ